MLSIVYYFYILLEYTPNLFSNNSIMVDKNKFETVIFHHIPKTAGTTFYSIIESQFPKEAIYTINGNQLEHEKSIESFKNLNPHELSKVKILKGHNVFGLDKYFPQPCTYFAIIRKPELRFISSYYSMLRGKQSLPERIEFINNKPPLEEYINQGDLYFGHNSMCKIIINRQEKDLIITNEIYNSILQKLEDNFSVIGLTESFDETIVLANKEFNWNINFYQRKNEAGNYNKEALDKKYIKLYKEKNPYDVKLYEFLETKFNNKINDYGSHFKKDLSKFQKQNKNKNRRIELIQNFKNKIKKLLNK